MTTLKELAAGTPFIATKRKIILKEADESIDPSIFFKHADMGESVEVLHPADRRMPYKMMPASEEVIEVKIHLGRVK